MAVSKSSVHKGKQSGHVSSNRAAAVCSRSGDGAQGCDANEDTLDLGELVSDRAMLSELACEHPVIRPS